MIPQIPARYVMELDLVILLMAWFPVDGKKIFNYKESY